jgi:hypothetical protein
MDEYVATETVRRYFREILDVLVETRQGATERVCLWVSGFFGSGKSHFLKVLGYILEDRSLQDPDRQEHSSTEFICRRLRLDAFLPLLTKELRTEVLFINLLDHDTQSPRRPTISRLIYRSLLEKRGLSTEFWVAEWEKEFQRLNKWQEFLAFVQKTYRRAWSEERKMNAEVALKRALPRLLPDHYHSEEEAALAIEESKRKFSTLNPSDVVASLCKEAVDLDKNNGRIMVLLDEVGLYIGDSIPRLTDLNNLAEQVVQRGEGKVLLIATAQEALPELVPRLTRDRQILEYLRDRFRLHLGLQPTEVQSVVVSRLLMKTSQGVGTLQSLYQSHQGALRSSLVIDRSWRERDFIDQYPCPPYAITLMQDIMGAMRGSVEEARRLSGSERSMLKLIHVILTGEGAIIEGAKQELGWLASLNVFYDALAPDLSVIRSEQVRIIRDLAKLGNMDGLPVANVAKALFLLQHLQERLPCTIENITAALVDRVDLDVNWLREATQKALQKLQQEGWVTVEESRYRLLTPAEHDLERDVRANYPTSAELKEGVVGLFREMVRGFRYGHGQIHRPLAVAFEVDGQPIQEEGDLEVELFTPLSETSEQDAITESINAPNTIVWKASEQAELRPALERTLSIQKTIDQWRSRSLTPQQESYRNQLEKEMQTARQIRLPQIMQQALLQGSIFLGGKKLAAAGNDVASAMNFVLRDIATQLYTEFVDDRPERDEDCAAILGWRPGTSLHDIYSRRCLVMANQIHHDAGLLATMKAELKRRQQSGLSHTGKDLLEHFEGRPYGYDPRLTRLLVATLFKAGLVGARYQNRDLTDPTDLQAREVFVKDREFRRVIFSLLPEVEWRKAGEFCSSLFGVQGGDTFERTATVVQEQATYWTQQAQHLATRCRDNGLPAKHVDVCLHASQTLADVMRLTDYNARLRRFLELADTLREQMPMVHWLKDFNFDEYRLVHTFVQTAGEWADSLSGEATQRWERLHLDIVATDLSDRWDRLLDDYAFLLDRYRSDYASAHEAFQKAIKNALPVLRQHEAFRQAPEKVEKALQPITTLTCAAADSTPIEDDFRCSTCHRSLVSLSAGALMSARRNAENALDALLPAPSPETIKPLSLRRTLAQEDEFDELVQELLSFWRKARRPVDVQVDARVKGNGT